MDKTQNEARDVFLIGAFFMGYALLLWLVARREGQSLGDAPVPNHVRRFLNAVYGNAQTANGMIDRNRLEFALTQRERMIAEETANGD